ncbi:MAG TPA: CHASE3 domain-containing protein, partial [Rhodocyclaceae bacterium]
MFKKLKIGGRLRLGFVAVIALMLLMAGVTFVNLGRMEESNRWNTHSYQVLQESGGLLLALVNIETGQRGYSLTGAEASLEPLNAGKTAFEKHLEKIRSLTADNAKQQERLQKLAESYQRWMSGAVEPAIQLRRDIARGVQRMDAAVALEQSAKGKHDMDGMRSVLGELESAESELLTARQAEAMGMRTETRWMLVLGSLLAMLLGMAIAWLVARSITAPVGAVVDAAKKIAAGDCDFELKREVADEIGELVGAVQAVQSNVRALIDDATMLSDAAVAGRFETRADAARHPGEFGKIVSGVNATLDVVVDKLEWYRSIIDAVPFPIHVTDLDMKWTFLNKPFEKLMVEQGYVRDRQDAVGRPCSTANANICKTKNCGIAQLRVGVKESFFDWCGMNCKQDTAPVLNAKGET